MVSLQVKAQQSHGEATKQWVTAQTGRSKRFALSAEKFHLLPPDMPSMRMMRSMTPNIPLPTSFSVCTNAPEMEKKSHVMKKP